MKNSIFNKRSGRKGNLLATLLVVTASLLISTSAYARVFTVGETIYVNTKYHSWFNNDNCYPALSTSSDNTSDNDFAAATSYSSDKLYALVISTTTEITDYLYIHRVNSSGRNNRYKLAVGEGNEFVILSNQNDNEWLGNWRTYNSAPTAYNVWLYTSSATPKVYAFLSKGESKLLGEWSGKEATLDDSNEYSWYTVSLPADIHDLKYKLILTSNGSAQYPSDGSGTEFNATDAVMWYYNNNGTGTGGIKDISKYQFYFSDETTLTPTAFIADNPKYGFYATTNLTAGTYKFGWKYDGTAKTGDNLKFSNTRGNVTTLEKVDSDTYLQLTLSTSSSVTFYVDPGSEQVFADAEAVVTTQTETYLAQSPVVSGSNVTLYGYLKYTGCPTNDITTYGFVYSDNLTTLQTTPGTCAKYTKAGDPAPALTASSEFNVTGQIAAQNTTYYYRSYVVADDVYYYSTDYDTFTQDCVCDISGTITATIDGESSVSKAVVGTSATAQLATATCANTYVWSVVSGDVTKVTLENANAASTKVSIIASGTYTFKVTVSCDDVVTAESNTVTFSVCAEAKTQTLYLDDHAGNNVLCQGEKATATITGQAGYTYSLYLGTRHLGTQTSKGSTVVWRNVDGSGVFTVKASYQGKCEATIATATQTYNIPTLRVDLNPGASVVSYCPVTLTKVESDETGYIDTDITWVVETDDDGYLLNAQTGMAYDGRARKSVILKGNAHAKGTTPETYESATYNVQATGYKTVTFIDGDDEVSKSCPSTITKQVVVSPATENCTEEDTCD